jgi:hypothetical protein
MIIKVFIRFLSLVSISISLMKISVPSNFDCFSIRRLLSESLVLNLVQNDSKLIVLLRLSRESGMEIDVLRFARATF